MSAPIKGNRVVAPPGTLYEVDENRLTELQSEVQRMPAREAVVLAYRNDPPCSTNAAIAFATRLLRAREDAPGLSVSSVKRADAYLKQVGVVRARPPP